MLLYLHIPFCHRVCPYCSFYKHTPGATSIGSFVDALAAETKSRLTETPRTIYLGGGTPSMLSPGHLSKLFAALHGKIDFSKLDEVTMEANPATFDSAKARLFRDLGVTRVSLGIQSFTPHVLEILGREHSAEPVFIHPERCADALIQGCSHGGCAEGFCRGCSFAGHRRLRHGDREKPAAGKSKTEPDHRGHDPYQHFAGVGLPFSLMPVPRVCHIRLHAYPMHALLARKGHTGSAISCRPGLWALAF